MGVRFGFIAVCPAHSATEMLHAIGVTSMELAGSEECPLPWVKLEPDEALFFQHAQWSILACPYNGGVLRDYDASPLVKALPNAFELRYFGQEDTNGELFVQCFKSGALVFSHFEHEGIIEMTYAVGDAPSKDPYGQTDFEKLFSSMLPFEFKESTQFERFKFRPI